jgi:hypothetical protein
MKNAIAKSNLSRLLMITFLLALPITFTTNLWAAKCVGADPCHACNNCGRCAKDGKKWGDVQVAKTAQSSLKNNLTRK